MAQSRHDRLLALFEAARGMPEADRSRWLKAVAGDDPALLEEVRSLLLHHQPGSSFLENPAVKPHEAPTTVQPRASGSRAPGVPPPEDPKKIGRYLLKQRLGEGGMGVVYLAQREDGDGTAGALVALKLLRSTVASDEEKQRFEREKRLLSALEHPNIARLLDADTTDDGHPYFVMEYVRGRPVDRYCDENRLTTEERLALFRKVCDAVQYVHQNLIIHRDIKPGNILVTQEGEPKLLDFGISRLVNPALDPSIEVTRPGFRLLTPRYASPEQVRDLPLSTATDVYSLGVLLYEMLTGHWPYAVRTTELREIERAICDLEPDRPSTAVERTESFAPDGRTKPVDPAGFAREHGAAPTKVRSRLRGDLDNILLKALDKVPRRRYGSVAQFAEDIRRHLSNETVLARPSSLRYRAEKFLRRNRGLVAGLAAVLVTLSAGLVATTLQYREAQAARLRAEAGERAAQQAGERARARADDIRLIATRLIDDFHRQIVNLEGTIPARAAMAETAIDSLERLIAEAPDDRRLRLLLAQALLQHARTFADSRSPSQGDIAGASALMARALSIARAVLDEDPSDASARMTTVDCLARSADVRRLNGDLAGAEPLYRQAGELLAPHAEGGERQAQALRSLGFVTAQTAECAMLQGRLDQAADLYEQAMALKRRYAELVPGDEAQRSISVGHIDLGGVHLLRGDHARALVEFERAATIRRELLRARPDEGRPRRDLARALLHLAEGLLGDGRPAEALGAAEEAAEIAGALADSPNGPADVRDRLSFVQAAAIIARAWREPADRRAVARRLDRARRAAERLMTDAPGVVEHRRAYIDILLACAEEDLRADDPAGALAALHAAREAASTLASVPEPVPWDRIALASVHRALGDAESARARQSGISAPARAQARARAREWYDSALALLDRARGLRGTAHEAERARAGIAALAAEESP